MSSLYLTVVFMGSRKYPNDNDFDVYISEHGGSSNAFTECEQVSAQCRQFLLHCIHGSKFTGLHP